MKQTLSYDGKVEHSRRLRFFQWHISALCAIRTVINCSQQLFELKGTKEALPFFRIFDSLKF